MANTKTPVMVLQELAVKMGWQSPEFTVIHAKQGTHENEFHYQVTVQRVIAIGVGRSKQIAKHEAARKMLEKLQELDMYCPDETVVQAPRSGVPGSAIKIAVNAIGTLCDVCVENKIPMPKFTPISDVGPPHCKEFTVQCQIASIITKATSGTKKQAKQWAAKEMLERIMHVLPELVAECSSENENFSLAITEQDDKACERYELVKMFIKPKPNLSLKIQDYDTNLKNIIEEKELSIDDMRQYLNKSPSEENLKEFLDHLELDYKIELLFDYPSVVALSLTTDVPFTVMAEGVDYEAAVQRVLRTTFRNLSILLK